MPSIISAGTTANTGLNLTADTSGNLVFQTNGNTTAMTIDTSQNVTYANGVSFTGVIGGNGANISSMNASNLTSGTVANARTTAASANGASTIVLRDSSGAFSAGVITANGSGLTGISASNISTGTLAAARLPAGSVLQVVSTFTQTQSSFTGNDTYQSYTALNTSITPSSSSNKILILISFGAFGCGTGTTTCALQLLRNSTPIGVGSTSGSQKAATFKTVQWQSDGNHGQGGVGFTFLDSPATTSSITYSFNINPQNAFTWWINRTANGGTGGEAYSSTTGSSMTLLEIAG